MSARRHAFRWAVVLAIWALGLSAPAHAAQAAAHTWLTADTGDSRTCAIRSDRSLWCWG
jgi:hypothetical protein